MEHFWGRGGELRTLLKGPADMWLFCWGWDLNRRPIDHRHRDLTHWVAGWGPQSRPHNTHWWHSPSIQHSHVTSQAPHSPVPPNTWRQTDLRAAGTPERPSKGREDGVSRQVLGFLVGPIVGGEGPSQGYLAQRRHKVSAPEEKEEVVELEEDQVLVIVRLSSIKSEKTLCIRTLRRDVGGVESLKKKKKTGVSLR